MRGLAAAFWSVAGLVGVLGRPRVATAPPPPACAACRHFAWTIRGVETHGHCRRYAPAVAVSMLERWPTVAVGDACGEFDRDPSPNPHPCPEPETAEAFRLRVLGDSAQR